MQIVSPCIVRDLPVFRVTCESLRTHVPGAEIHVITRKADFAKFRDACGSDLILWDEVTLLPQISIEEVGAMDYPFLPASAGWYFQQFLKFAFLDVSNDDEHYLIWDADTVLLRSIDFFDKDGRPYYTEAAEHHEAYFETYEALLGTPAEREFSFITQHQVINKPMLRRMLEEIETRNPDSRNWAWAIMESLRGAGGNLFSEYETYGHYAKSKNPGGMAFRDLEWTRYGGKYAGYPPKPRQLRKLAERYAFAAFENYFSPLGQLIRVAKRIRRKLRPNSL